MLLQVCRCRREAVDIRKKIKVNLRKQNRSPVNGLTCDLFNNFLQTFPRQICYSQALASYISYLAAPLSAM